MQGRGADGGIVHLISDNIFNLLEEKRYQNHGFNFNVKIRHLEVVDEEAFDLLQPGGGHGYNKNNVRFHEWEGAQVQGIKWIPVPSAHQLNEFFSGGVRNRTQRINEFGKMSEKASQLFQIEVT